MTICVGDYDNLFSVVDMMGRPRYTSMARCASDYKLPPVPLTLDQALAMIDRKIAGWRAEIAKKRAEYAPGILFNAISH